MEEKGCCASLISLCLHLELRGFFLFVILIAWSHRKISGEVVPLINPGCCYLMELVLQSDSCVPCVGDPCEVSVSA